MPEFASRAIRLEKPQAHDFDLVGLYPGLYANNTRFYGYKRGIDIAIVPHDCLEWDATAAKNEPPAPNEQANRMRSLFEYGQRPRIDVFVSNEYTHWSAWAHTEPDRHVIMMRPEESTDYRLSVFPHEVVHNYAPGLGNEDHVTQMGQGPLYPHIRDLFRFCYH